MTLVDAGLILPAHLNLFNCSLRILRQNIFSGDSHRAASGENEHMHLASPADFFKLPGRYSTQLTRGGNWRIFILRILIWKSKIDLTQWELSHGGFMKRVTSSIFLIGLFTLLGSSPVWAQSGGHASVGLGHGEEGYLHLQEMVKHFEYSLKMDDASPDLKMHGAESLKHAQEALKHYKEALTHASESLGRPAENPMMGGGSGGEHSHDEGSGHNEGPPQGQGGKRGPGMPEGSQH